MPAYNQCTMENIDSLISMVRNNTAYAQMDTLEGSYDTGEQKFDEMLQVMMFSSQLDGMSSASSGSSSSLFGSDLFMMPFMMNLVEQLMATRMGSLEAGTPLELASMIQINQFEAEMQLGGDGINANCGPASLAMAMRSLGAAPYSGGMDGGLVDYARRLMIDDPQRDGLGAGGMRAEWEHNSYTSLAEIAQGAENGGLESHRLTPSSSAIIMAVQSGARVIASGTFRGKEPLPWTGDTERDFYRAPGGATEHFVLVSGYDDRTGKLIINDPARHSPIAVYPHQLDEFMRGNEGALAVYR